uniref:NADH-ubiquinone oxidoreductase chain 2 n=1 Tax=Pielomastax zhengi TaxID=997267 RepID=G8DZ93_9ORTH|nr:NADH dehydrogenase subunit 2 [Pielomastax zhengi]ADZ62103.1 NADH dehydrogenase subunit 2 [Pielomastax zhengi]
MNNATKIMFLSVLLMGTLLTLSANSWLAVWVGLEVNLVSFIPLLYSSNSVVNEMSIKYFIVQALASSMLLFAILFIQMKSFIEWEETFITTLLVGSSLLMKMGAAPMHFWLPEVMKYMSWSNCLLLMTWQKIAPMVGLSYCMKTNSVIILIAILSVLMGAIGGLNQTSLRKMMAYSSISHIGGVVSTLSVSETIWEIYFIMYSFLSILVVMMFDLNKIFFLNQVFGSNNENKFFKSMMWMSLLSLGGLPPFLGFFPKWIVIQTLMEEKMVILIGLLVITTLITLYFYLRLAFASLVVLYSESKWILAMKIRNQPKFVISMVSLVSNSMLMAAPIFMYFL